LANPKALLDNLSGTLDTRRRRGPHPSTLLAAFVCQPEIGSFGFATSMLLTKSRRSTRHTRCVGSAWRAGLRKIVIRFI
jgi:hypothetical protein